MNQAETDRLGEGRIMKFDCATLILLQAPEHHVPGYKGINQQTHVCQFSIKHFSACMFAGKMHVIFKVRRHKL